MLERFVGMLHQAADPSESFMHRSEPVSSPGSRAGYLQDVMAAADSVPARAKAAPLAGEGGADAMLRLTR